MGKRISDGSKSFASKNIDYNHILDGIYIGTNQCCQTHFDKELRKEGIDADISIEEERIDAPFGVGFYIWLPVKNQEAPTNDQFDFGVSVPPKPRRRRGRKNGFDKLTTSSARAKEKQRKLFCWLASVSERRRGGSVHFPLEKGSHKVQFGGEIISFVRTFFEAN